MQPWIDHNNYRSRTESGKSGPLSRRLAWHVAHDRGLNGLQQAESRRKLQAMDRERMPFGQRLREVRLALGWTPSMIADELGISVRTVIRHEQGSNRTGRPHLRVLLRLRELESRYAAEVLAYLARVRHPWLPSEQCRLDP
jgi:DNA-binding XRE family transcriptional regulator